MLHSNRIQKIKQLKDKISQVKKRESHPNDNYGPKNKKAQLKKLGNQLRSLQAVLKHSKRSTSTSIKPIYTPMGNRR
ncbi:MAG: hypothetical protein RLO81_00905 [Fulvivirga sp.]|uniref:hypothetical protein n=1 Tax=Fulvivirga sp. TaxID=1931237 RepID=UPI0032EDB8A6